MSIFTLVPRAQTTKNYWVSCYMYRPGISQVKKKKGYLGSWTRPIPNRPIFKHFQGEAGRYDVSTIQLLLQLFEGFISR